jgi:protocatechuate 3,4-dioxygenase alpha subunit
MIGPLMSRQPARLTATPSQTVGPFFHFALARDAALGTMAGPGASGERIRLRIAVFDGDAAPVPDALIELWQADADGKYLRPADPAAPVRPAFSGFGRLPTGADGSCQFETIRPGRVRDEGGRLQAPHINVCLFSRGLLRQIYTRVYFEGDRDLDDDAVLAFVPPDRRHTLLATPMPGAGDTWLFEIRLQGDRETVFFDL